MLSRRQNGFTLLETLVALVILSLFFVTVWEWFSVATKSTTSIERALELPGVYRQFKERFALETLKENRQGEMNINGLRIVWRAEIDRISTQEFYRRQPAWIVALFDVTADIYDEQLLINTVSTSAVRQWQDPLYVPREILEL